MTTLYGGPMPPDFTDGEELTADGFNAVKNYWIIEGDLPDAAEDGDVVFVVGEPVKVDELPGIGGWAEITSVEGDGNKYEYTADGLEWSAWEFTGDGSFTVGGEDGLIEFLLVASATRHSGSSGGKGGAVLNGLEMIDAGTATSIIVGKTTDGASYGSANGSAPSSLTHEDGEVIFAGDVGGWSNPYAAGNGGIQSTGTGIYSSIFGTKRGFGGGATANGFPYGVNPAVDNSGAGAMDNAQSWPNGEPQNNGVVGIRVPKANDKTGTVAGPFSTTTKREKAAAAVEKRNQPVMDGDK